MPTDEAQMCQCLNNNGSCDSCEVDCLSDCNDLTSKEGKCYSGLACNTTTLITTTKPKCSPPPPPMSVCMVVCMNSASCSNSKCEADCKSDCNDLKGDGWLATAVQSYYRRLLDNEEICSLPAPKKMEGGTQMCQCLNNNGSCDSCEVDCMSDCNDLTSKEGKCYSGLACNPLLLFEFDI